MEKNILQLSTNSSTIRKGNNVNEICSTDSSTSCVLY